MAELPLDQVDARLADDPTADVVCPLGEVDVRVRPVRADRHTRAPTAEEDRIDRGSIHEEADALLAAGNELRANLESMRQRLARFGDGLVDSPPRSEAIPYAASSVPAAEPTHADLAHQRRDGVSADADRRDELRQLFSDTETVDVRLEGLGEELFSDDEA